MGSFPSDGKKLILPQFIKKNNNKQLIENCCPISLLSVCGKKLERLIYNRMLEFFTENELISHNQSGFKPGDSCTNQLLCINHDIYQSLDDDLETRGVFLDQRHLIRFGTMVFPSSWSKMVYMSGNLLNVITDFLNQSCFEWTALVLH